MGQQVLYTTCYNLMVKQYYLLPASSPIVATDIYCCISRNHLIHFDEWYDTKGKYIKKLLLAVDNCPEQHNNMSYNLCTIQQLKIKFVRAVLSFNSNDN